MKKFLYTALALCLSLGVYLGSTQAMVLPSKYQSLVKIEVWGMDRKTHEPEEEGHGSGVIVGPTTVFTAKHVAVDFNSPDATLYVIDSKGVKHNVVKVTLDPDHDFATVEVDTAFKGIKAAPISCTPVKPLDRVFVVGFPLDFGAMIFENIAAGYVDTTTLGDDEDGIILFVTGVSLPGNSGGPVFSNTGKLVGVLVAEWNDVQNNQDSDVNMVVPVTETVCKGVV